MCMKRQCEALKIYQDDNNKDMVTYVPQFLVIPFLQTYHVSILGCLHFYHVASMSDEIFPDEIFPAGIFPVSDNACPGDENTGAWWT